jgi:hypothetical protein
MPFPKQSFSANCEADALPKSLERLFPQAVKRRLDTNRIFSVNCYRPGQGASGSKLRRIAITTSLMRVPASIRLSCASSTFFGMTCMRCPFTKDGLGSPVSPGERLVALGVDPTLNPLQRASATSVFLYRHGLSTTLGSSYRRSTVCGTYTLRDIPFLWGTELFGKLLGMLRLVIPHRSAKRNNSLSMTK